ncbi:MAG: adenosine deaminase [Parcubacteria group bacterium Gr01-1014_13]|nr:MAG: adenosine deaminase [Parcubacteria group bacterium Gr01-1014_13]
MSTILTHDEIYRLPKIDLHRHVDGAIKPETLIRLAKEFGVKLPTYELDEFTKLYQITEPDMSIDQIFQRFGWGIAVMRTPHGLHDVFREQVHDLAEENILCAELRFAPGYHSIYPPPWYKPEMYETEPFPAMSLHQTVCYALAGIERGMKETGIAVNLTLSIPRESLSVWGKNSVEAIVKLALQFQNEGVVAIDLACDEYTYTPDPYIPYFRATRGSRIRRNPHGGEMGSPEQRLKNIATCLNGLNADGIGHALEIYQSIYLMFLARCRNIRIERTPLSPVPGCSLADGHLDVLLKHKVPVVITSDDPVLMQASLTDNWLAALNYHQFTDEQFWQMTANAVNTAFYRDEAQKTRVQEEFVKRGLSESLLRR